MSKEELIKKAENDFSKYIREVMSANEFTRLFAMGFNLTINDQLYYIKCDNSVYRNKNEYNGNYFGLHLSFVVKNVTTNRYLQGFEVGSYLKEKISDYIYNSINGQRSIYYNWYGKNENGKVIKGE